MTSRHAIRLRFTGENPTIEALGEYPNWVNAYDEEGFEGQDETTLKPEDDQLCITDQTAFTAGEVVFGDGSKLPVLISLLNSEVTGFSVYREPEWPYLSYDEYWNRWSVLPDLLSPDRDRGEQWWKLQQFPARVSSKLPLRSTDERWSVVIDGDGLVIP